MFFHHYCPQDFVGWVWSGFWPHSPHPSLGLDSDPTETRQTRVLTHSDIFVTNPQIPPSLELLVRSDLYRRVSSLRHHWCARAARGQKAGHFSLFTSGVKQKTKWTRSFCAVNCTNRQRTDGNCIINQGDLIRFPKEEEDYGYWPLKGRIGVPKVLKAARVCSTGVIKLKII